MPRLGLVTCLVLALAAPASAQLLGATTPVSATATAGSDSTEEFRSARMRLQHEMEIRLSGNADRDFAASMIRHHEGAIAMARIQLRHGEDADMWRLAEDIIREQEAEISRLRDFLVRTVSLQ